MHHGQERLQMLRAVAPGTALREGLENILSAGTGALIVVGDSEPVKGLAVGGFRIDSPFSASALYELAKMDGAIILTPGADRILIANAQLIAAPEIPSSETGIRHRTAQRVARQTGELVIAISQRRRQITLYQGSHRYILRDTSAVLTRANQALQALERHRSVLNQSLADLGALEFEGEATLPDVVSVVQRGAFVDLIADQIHGYVVELGDEGRITRMQLQVLLQSVSEQVLLVIADYAADGSIESAREVKRLISTWRGEHLSDSAAIARQLGYQTVPEQPLHPRGLRVLRRVPRLSPVLVERLIAKFCDLDALMAASLEQLDEVEGIGAARARWIQEALQRLRDQAMFERHL